MSDEISLSLSGGGFRASLFHIGTLMNLAENGLLGKVTTLSTVSGGSIIGVLYYLHLKYYLETEENPKESDIIKIVENVKDEFTKTVSRKNIIIQPFCLKNSRKLIRTISSDYTRTNLLAEIYQREIYDSIWKKIVNFWKSQKERPEEWKNVDKDEETYLCRLKIYPRTAFKESKDFEAFDMDIFNRESPIKIPDLIINATNLNTGNLWRFSATKFGEYLSINEILTVKGNDLKEKFKDLYRLKSKYGIWKLFELYIDEEKMIEFYKSENLSNVFPTIEKFKDSLYRFFKEINKLIENHMYHFFKDEYGKVLRKRIKVGDAVSASACVPGVFSPYMFRDKYYYNNIYGFEIIRLVDGGVYDNQGLESVERKFQQKMIEEKREENLGLVFCSDASGQMSIERVTSFFIDIKSVFRSSEIIGNRMRNLTIDKLYEKKNRGTLEFILIHLKMKTEGAIENLFPELKEKAKDIEEVLILNSKLRIQLNKFWEEEIKSLIAHGYILSGYYSNRFIKHRLNPVSEEFKGLVHSFLKEIFKDRGRYKRILTLGQNKLSTIPIWFYRVKKKVCIKFLVQH